MTTSSTAAPTRTVILGGGGAVGIGWQVGMLVGLQETGPDLAAADIILGTSAGAVVGALLAGGRDIMQAFSSMSGLAHSMPPAQLRQGNDRFLRAMRAAALDGDTGGALRTVGAAALAAETLDEDRYLALFDLLLDTPWPAGFCCTAIDAGTGELTVWTGESGVALREAVAASCALPMLFPPVTVAGRRYLDGGLLSHLNATAAPASDVVVALSCHPLQDSPLRALSPSETRAVDELTVLREHRSVLAVEPDFSGIGVTPESMMDPDMARRAHEAGRRQVTAIATHARTVWGV